MKKQLITVSAVIIAAVSLSFCSESTAKNENNSQIKTTSEALISNDEAKALLDSKCMVCHKVQDSKDAMLAPPFAHIKKKYKKVSSSKKEFISKFTDFAVNPKEDKAMMYGALKQFKVMPNMGYDKEEMQKIANYVYENEFPEPAWCKK